MPVPKSKRNQTPLEVLTEARTLAIYTIRLCTNEDKFPKRYRWCLSQDIVRASAKVSENCAKANSIFVNDAESYKLRRSYQQEALAELEGLENNMILAFELFDGLRHMDPEDKPKKKVNISSWTSQKIKVKSMLLAWKKSDTEHFKTIMANRC